MKKILISLVTVAVVSIAAVGATRAYFSSTVTSSGNTFSAGTLVLGHIPQTAIVSYNNIYPGWNYHDESHWGYDYISDVVVQNNGSLPLKYRVIASTTTPISDYVFDNVLAGVYVDGIAGTSNHVELYKGTLRGLLNYITVDANFDTSPHTGWWGNGERVFFEFAVPPTVGNEFQGQSLNFNLTFDATQTNNPAW
jgi:predicted ribosomally synthesized peptide with SipW-like signal peptide